MKLQSLQNNGELKGLKIAKGVKDTNHAQYADDKILLGWASVTIAERFRESLSIFLKASDGKVNALKTKIYGWNFPKRTMAMIIRTLGYLSNTNWNSFNYLRVPIHKGKKKYSDWKDILRKHGGRIF